MKNTLKLRFLLNLWKYPLFAVAVRIGGNELHEAVKADAARILKCTCEDKDAFACLVSYKIMHQSIWPELETESGFGSCQRPFSEAIEMWSC